MKKIIFCMLTAILLCTLPALASSKIISIMMTSGNKQADADTPGKAVVVIGFNDGSEYQGEAPLINNSNPKLKAKQYAVIDITKVPAEFQQKFKDAVSPLSNYILVNRAGERRGDIDGSTGAATGTPGRLLWKNFIGSYVHEQEPGMPGAQRRTDLCLGTCSRQQ